MIEHVTVFWCQAFEQLRLLQDQLEAWPDPRAELSAEFKDSVSRREFFHMIEQDKALLADDALDYKVMALRNDLRSNAPLCAESLARDLHFMRAQVIVALGRKKFAWIQPPYDHYFNQIAPFNGLVRDKLPEANIELQDAANALAAELGTAAVFHLVRASEHALRALAKALRVKLSHKSKPQPLEFADWNKIITECKNLITKARSLPSSSKKDMKLQLYSRVADHCEYIKDLWRNELAHTRKRYSALEALSIFDRMKDFFGVVCEQVL